MEFRQGTERIVEQDQFRQSAGCKIKRVVQRHGFKWTTALGSSPGACVIYQNVAHCFSRDSEKMASRFPLLAGIPSQTQVRLMDECCDLQGVRLTLSDPAAG